MITYVTEIRSVCFGVPCQTSATGSSEVLLLSVVEKFGCVDGVGGYSENVNKTLFSKCEFTQRREFKVTGEDAFIHS